MRKYLYAVGAGALVFVAFYFTWCWGVWGRDNTFMKYYFQCACPRVSENARYKPFRVVASACSDSTLLDVSSDGKYILLFAKAPNPMIVRVNLENGETFNMNYRSSVAQFLTSDLVLIATVQDARYFLVNVLDGMAVEVQFEPNLEKAFSAAKHMEKVWWNSGLAVAINSDYKNNPESRIVFMTTGATHTEQRESLVSHGIHYEPERFPLIPKNGLYADVEGIYLNNQLLVGTRQSRDSTSSFAPLYWVLGGDAVMYENTGYAATLFAKPIELSQPILLLHVPDP